VNSPVAVTAPLQPAGSWPARHCPPTQIAGSTPTASSGGPAGLALPPRRFLGLQALEDAIAYRQARLAAPCPDCGADPGALRCDDHACDRTLITAYREAARAAIAEIESARGSAGTMC
jgi:hypothetical protein